MLKVAVVTSYFPTSATRWEGHSAYQTLRQLAGRADVHVFCPVVTYPAPLDRRSQRDPVDLNWQPPDVKATYVPYRAIPLLSRAVNGLTIARALLPPVQRFQPDLLLNYQVYPDGYAATRIGRRLKVPVVLTAIGSDLNRIPDPLVGRFVRSALRHASFVRTVSRDLAVTACCLGADPSRTEAMLNGCDTGIFYPRDRAQARARLNLPAEAAMILYVGRLDLRKGLLELVQALETLRSSHTQARCYLLGSGPAKAALEERIATLKLGDVVTFVPPCPTDQVALWMAAADLVTLPSYKEGSPNVVIEALGAGRPVVATNVGGIPELMDNESGYLVPPKDVPALRRALDEALTRPWDAAGISSRHSRSWQDCADDTLSLLQTLTAG